MFKLCWFNSVYGLGCMCVCVQSTRLMMAVIDTTKRHCCMHISLSFIHFLDFFLCISCIFFLITFSFGAISIYLNFANVFDARLWIHCNWTEAREIERLWDEKKDAAVEINSLCDAHLANEQNAFQSALFFITFVWLKVLIIIFRWEFERMRIHVRCIKPPAMPVEFDEMPMKQTKKFFTGFHYLTHTNTQTSEQKTKTTKQRRAYDFFTMKNTISKKNKNKK